MADEWVPLATKMPSFLERLAESQGITWKDEEAPRPKPVVTPPPSDHLVDKRKPRVSTRSVTMTPQPPEDARQEEDFLYSTNKNTGNQRRRRYYDYDVDAMPSTSVVAPRYNHAPKSPETTRMIERDEPPRKQKCQGIPGIDDLDDGEIPFVIPDEANNERPSEDPCSATNTKEPEFHDIPGLGSPIPPSNDVESNEGVQLTELHDTNDRIPGLGGEIEEDGASSPSSSNISCENQGEVVTTTSRVEMGGVRKPTDDDSDIEPEESQLSPDSPINQIESVATQDEVETTSGSVELGGVRKPTDEDSDMEPEDSQILPYSPVREGAEATSRSPPSQPVYEPSPGSPLRRATFIPSSLPTPIILNDQSFSSSHENHSPRVTRSSVRASTLSPDRNIFVSPEKSPVKLRIVKTEESAYRAEPINSPAENCTIRGGIEQGGVRQPTNDEDEEEETESPSRSGKDCLMCSKPAVLHPDWDGEYCSEDCVLKDCQRMFEKFKAIYGHVDKLSAQQACQQVKELLKMARDEWTSAANNRV